MAISENARAVLEKRYLMRDEQGNPKETVDDLFHRVAGAIAAADKVFDPQADTAATAERFYRMMTELEFLPNSPTLMNAGRPLGQLSACFVLPVGDSMEEIFDAIKNAALIHKIRRRHRLRLLPAAAQGVHRQLHRRRGQRPGVLYEGLQRRHRGGEAGGAPAGAPTWGILRVDHPGHHGVHHLQEQHQGDHQLQHLRRPHGGVHERGGEKPGL